MEDVTSKLKNFEKSKNENMFPKLTPQCHVVCQHPCFSPENIFLSPFSQVALCQHQEQGLLCSCYQRLHKTHNPQGFGLQTDTSLGDAFRLRLSYREGAEASVPGEGEGRLP